MLKNLLGAFVGAKAQANTGHPLAGAVVGATAMAIARRSLPVAVGLALGVVAMEMVGRYRARTTMVPAAEI